jgi:hypothetical protein
MERKPTRTFRIGALGCVALLGALTACTASNLSNPVPKPVALPVTASNPANPYGPPDANGFFYATVNVYTCLTQSRKILVTDANNDDTDFRLTVTILEGYQVNGQGTVLGSGASDITAYGGSGGYESDPIPAGTCLTVHMVWSNRGAAFEGIYEIDPEPVA